MVETFICVLFIFSLFCIGQGFLLLLKEECFAWLSIPIGLSIVTILHNFLYFGIDLYAWQIRILVFVIAVSCFIFLLYKKYLSKNIKIFLAVTLFFLFLTLPAWIGGEQYYVFRGNHWDHFNYINQTLTILNNKYSFYLQNNTAAQYSGQDIIFAGYQFLEARPVVSQIFASLLLTQHINLHLTAFLYTTSLWAVALCPFVFGWQQILQLSSGSIKNSLFIKAVPPLVIVVGFWGQYVFDINAWSQLASIPILSALIFVVFLWLPKTFSSFHLLQYKNAFIVTALFAAAGMLLYPEGFIIHACLISACLLFWFIVTRPQIYKNTALAFGLVIGTWFLLISPHVSALFRFMLNQVRFGATADVNWWAYFSSFILGSYDSPNIYLKFMNMFPSALGLYFITPDYAQPFPILALWLCIFFVFVCLSICFFIKFFDFKMYRGKQFIYIFQMFCVVTIIPLSYFLLREKWWSAGKCLSFIGPYIILFALIPLATYSRMELTSPLRKALLLFSVVILLGHLCFGFARPLYALGNDGIGYKRPYPSIQDPAFKNKYKWTCDIDKIRNENIVYLSTPTGKFNNLAPHFFHHYIKQKLTFAGIEYLYPEKRKMYYGTRTTSYEKKTPDSNLPYYVLILNQSSQGIYECNIKSSDNLSWKDVIDVSKTESFPESFHIAGIDGIWYDGQELELAMILPPYLRGKVLNIHIIPLVYNFMPLRIQSTANSQLLAEQVVTSLVPLTFPVSGQVSSSGMVNLTLTLTDDGTPQEHNMGFQYIIITESNTSIADFESYLIPPKNLSFDVRNELSFLSYKGLSFAEDWGRWTDGNSTVITMTLPDFLHRKPVRIELPLIHVFGEQRILPSINDRPLQELRLDKPETLTFQATEMETSNGRINLVLDLPDAQSPAAISNSSDTRVLAIGLKELIIEQVP